MTFDQSFGDLLWNSANTSQLTRQGLLIAPTKVSAMQQRTAPTTQWRPQCHVTTAELCSKVIVRSLYCHVLTASVFQMCFKCFPVCCGITSSQRLCIGLADYTVGSKRVSICCPLDLLHVAAERESPVHICPSSLNAESKSSHLFGLFAGFRPLPFSKRLDTVLPCAVLQRSHLHQLWILLGFWIKHPHKWIHFEPSPGPFTLPPFLVQPIISVELPSLTQTCLTEPGHLLHDGANYLCSPSQILRSKHRNLVTQT